MFFSKSLSLFALFLGFICVVNTFGQGKAPGQMDDPIPNQGSSMTPLEKHIHSVCQQVQDENKTTDKLTEGDLADLPVGIARQIGNSVYVVAIDSAYWNGKGWYFTVYASIKLPGSSQPIAFRGSNIGFNKGGLTLSETKLYLASPQYIAISDDVVLRLPSDGSNYLDFDCSGFKSVNLKGNFEFVDSFIVPDKSKTSDTRVFASVEIHTSDLSNIIASVTNFTPFKIKKVDDITFEVKSATVDLSDYHNPEGFSFPTDYQNPFGDSPNLWRGFYIQELTANIKTFTNNDSTTEWMPVSAKQILIDDAGVSGKISGTNILPFERGTSVGGWGISIDNISLEVSRNRFVNGTLNGKIGVPFLGEDPFAYTGEIAQENNNFNYRFLVATTEDKEYETVLAAYIKIKQGSTISLEKKDGAFTASATLHGSLSVKNGKMQAKGIDFQDLILLSRAPYIKAPAFSLSGIGPKAMGLPVKIENISLKTPEEGKAALGFDLSINFMNAESKGFSAKSTITIFAKMEQAPDLSGAKAIAYAARNDWKYDGIKFNDINLDCSTTAFSIKGKLNILENDPEFGDGFQGSLSLSIAKVLEKGVQVNAYFGSKDDFRYWHLDAYAPVVSIPVVPPLTITGIMGGASYKMSSKNDFKPDYSKLNTETSGPEQRNTMSNPSNFSYTPDANAGMSFLAGVTLIAGKEKVFNADATLEIALNASGGFRHVQFKGSGYFFTSLESRERASAPGEKVNAPVSADLNMVYDHTNGVFHSNMKTYMNLEGTIRGTGADNLMGETVMHYDPKDWYIYIGRSSQMLGVDIANLATGQGYFMAGTKIEGLPLPPTEMRDIMGKRNPELVRDETALALGRGFAVGVRFETGFDSKNKLNPFYAIFKMGAGADMMIRDFGNATCNGSTGKVGFDGWYASGQAYTYMKGKVGIKVRGSKFDFLSLGAAALLQAKLPNPTWVKGELAGKYSVLGGFVEGKFKVKIILGEECELITPGSELGDVLVIADIKPENSSSDVSVFASTQVSFNTAVETEFRMLNNQDQLNSYRIKLDEFSISNNGQLIPTTQEWNGKKDVLTLRTSETLPAQTQIRAFAKIHWEKMENGKWQPMLTDNAISYETKEINFTTGEAPNFIPDENIAFCYPVNRQYNLLPKETNQGYIKLKTGQAYLFTSDATEKWTLLARFTDPSGAVLETPMYYTNSELMVRFDLPAIKNETVYSLSLIKRPELAQETDSNVKRENIAKDAGEDSEVKIASTTLTGTATQKIEKEIYASAFRTSKFNTFNDKWAALNNERNLFDIAIGNIAVIGKSLTMEETFDEFELNGYPNRNQSLIQIIASTENNWLRQKMGPIIYDTYPVDPSVTISHRDPSVLGVTPLKALRLTNLQENYTLTDVNISSGVSVTKSGNVKLMYYLSYIGFSDFNELRNKAARIVTSGRQDISPSLTKMLSVPGYTDLSSGSYPVNVKYVLPGTNQATTEKQLVIQF
jgi:hypothetical protein